MSQGFRVTLSSRASALRLIVGLSNPLKYGVVPLVLLSARSARAEASTQRDAIDRPLPAKVEFAARSAAADTVKREPPKAPEGVSWQSADGLWQAQLLGRLQFDHRAYQPGGMVPDGFSLRRTRLGASVTYDRDYTFVLEGEYATGNASTTTQFASLVNGYLLLSWFRPNARIYLGQFKPQYGLENTGSDNLTDFTERSLQFSFLQNLSYDRGIMVVGDPRALTGLHYSLAATNGTGINTDEQAGSTQSVEADGKMVTLRVAENFAAPLKRPRDVYHLGFNHKRGSAANSPATPYTAATVQTEGRGVVFFTPQAFNATTDVSATNVDRRMTAYELALAHGPMKLQGEYWKVGYTGTRQMPAPATHYDLDLSAYYVELLWMVTGEEYVATYQDGQFGRIRPRHRFSPRDHTWGAWQVGIRLSGFDGGDFGLTGPSQAGRLSTSPPTTVPANQATAWTVGLTWILNPHARLLFNYVRTHFDTPITVNAATTDHESALVARAQIDF